MSSATAEMGKASAPLLPEPDAPRDWSHLTFLALVLNMLLASGPLTMPKAFHDAGFIYGTIVLLIFGALAYVTATWVLESLARGSLACGRLELIRLEVGELADLALSPRNRMLVVAVLSTYLYGILALYMVTIPKCIALLLPADFRCLGLDGYNFTLAIVGLLGTLLSLADLQRTKVLQIFVMLARFLACFSMLIICVVTYFHGSTDRKMPAFWHDVPKFNLAGTATLFGNVAMTFMVHHSLPSVTTTLREPTRAPRLLMFAYGFSFQVYIILCTAGLLIFSDEAFDRCPPYNSHGCVVQDLFNLNFSSYHIHWLAYYLQLYPVLNLSVVPVMAITLRNNLLQLFGLPAFNPAQVFTRSNILTTLLATLPPVLVAVVTQEVQLVVTVTGSYAGATICFIVPGALLAALRSPERRASCGEALPATLAPLGARGSGPCARGFLLVVAVGFMVYNTVRFAIAA